MRRDSTCITRSISFSRPITGSSLPSRAAAVRFRPNWSSMTEAEGAVPDGAPAAAGSVARGARQQLDHLLADPAGVSAQLDEHLGGDALALTDQAEQDVLGADVVVTEGQGLPQRQLEDLRGARSEGDVPGGFLLALAGDLPDVLADRLQADPQRLKGLGGDAVALADQAEQDVLGADVVVTEHPGLFLSQDRNPPRPVGEPLEHLVAPSPSGRRGNRSLARPFAC